VSFNVAFVMVFAGACVFVMGLAILGIWKTTDHPNKFLWIVGCLFGFVGFGLAPESGNDLLMHFGLQIPVVHGKWSSAEGLTLKAMYPVVAVVALSRLRRLRGNAS
jgi:hypothetical protein